MDRERRAGSPAVPHHAACGSGPALVGDRRRSLTWLDEERYSFVPGVPGPQSRHTDVEISPRLALIQEGDWRSPNDVLAAARR